MRIVKSNFVLIIMCAAATALAADSPGAGPLKQAEKEFVAAVTKPDVAALDRILADELVYTHSGGNTDTKASYIEALKSGRQKYLSIDYESEEVRLYGNTAVVFSVVNLRAETKGQVNTPKLRMIHVYVKKQGRWQLVAHQSTRLT